MKVYQMRNKVVSYEEDVTSDQEEVQIDAASHVDAHDHRTQDIDGDDVIVAIMMRDSMYKEATEVIYHALKPTVIKAIGIFCGHLELSDFTIDRSSDDEDSVSITFDMELTDNEYDSISPYVQMLLENKPDDITLPTRVTSHWMIPIDRLFTSAQDIYAFLLDKFESDYEEQLNKMPTKYDPNSIPIGGFDQENLTEDQINQLLIMSNIPEGVH